MRVILYPFFSQQDKRQRLFRLDSDSGVRLYSYMAARLVEAGHDVAMVVPPIEQCVDALTFPCRTIRSPKLCIDNLDRRLQWDPTWLRSLECDLLLTQHEFLAYPFRCLHPQTKIFMECGMRPDTAWPETREMFPLAWRAADLVHCNSDDLATQMPNSTVWRFGYDDDIAISRGLSRDIDVLFPARASATNYSNHEAFLKAFEGSPLTTKLTDPTSFLGNAPLSRAEYLTTLHRSRVVVGLTDNGYGGYAFIEAVAAGACPVALRSYAHLLTDAWPYFCELGGVREVTERALKLGWAGVSTKIVRRVQQNLLTYSYSSAWAKAKEDINEVCKRN
jgi:hypothetical protein